MHIMLDIEPEILCHFNSSKMRNHFKSGDQTILGNDYTKKKIGDSSYNLNFGHKVFTTPYTFSYTTSITISYWQYRNGIPSNTNGNGNSVLGSFYFGLPYINSSNIISIEITKTIDPWVDYTIEQQIYNISSDLNQWVHLEWSFDSTSKLIRFFRNGTLIWSYTLPGSVFNRNISFNQDYVNLQELLVIQKCMHTANFTPAIEEYVWIDKDQEYKDKEEILYGYK